MEWNNLRQVLGQYGEMVVKEWREMMDRDGKNATGTLYNSIKYRVNITDDAYDVIFDLADYFQYVENGRGPGNFPPMDAIREWIRQKPVLPSEDSNGKLPSEDQLAFLIGRKIANEGIPGTHYFESAKEISLLEFEEKINEAIEQDVMADIEKNIEI